MGIGTLRMGLTAAVGLVTVGAVAALVASRRESSPPSSPVEPPPVDPTPPVDPRPPGRSHQPSVPPGGPVHDVVTGQKLIALTFDDGPSAANTDAILATLERHGARATFFVVGSEAERRPGQLRAMQDAGHAIGNHTWEHPDLRRLGDAEIASQLARTSDAIEAATGQRPDIFRAPYGGRSDRVDAVAATVGMRDILWSVDTNDWRRPGADEITRRVVEGARPGAVVLMHDGGGDRSQTAASLDATLSQLAALGYEFVTVPELIARTTTKAKGPGR